MNEEELRDIFANNLTYYMKMYRLTQSEVSKITGVSQQSVSNWINGKQMPRMGVIEKLANYFHINKSNLLESSHEQTNDLFHMSMHPVPMLDIHSPDSELPKENSILYETKDTEKADCCLKMPDDSMINARIHEGDIVFVHKQDTVKNGEIAAIILNDTASLKRFYYYKDKKFIVLRHDNPKYEDIILTEDGFDTIQIIGKAIAFQSKI